jgi:hypothetical protein
MKIIMFRHGRNHSSIYKSQLLSDEQFAQQELYLLARPPLDNMGAQQPVPRPGQNNRQYVMAEKWQ